MAINTRPDIHEQIICANVLIRKDGKYLVLRRSPLKRYAPDVVHPFGGKVDLGENPHTAALREVYEETGLQVTNLRLEAVILELTPVIDEPYNWLVFHFSADFESGELQVTDEGEAALLTAEELKAEKLFPSFAAVTDHILDAEQGTVFATFEYDSERKNIINQTLDACVVQ